INASGEIVGLCRRQGGIPHAFLWRNGHMTDLNRAGLSASGWTLTEAVGINASGQIVGTGFRNHRYHAFLLTPLPLSTTRR
ncbi:MAG: PEP-CTERM sorting domain-containing protein, partial [Armatimonadota bacterium]|nr:PEP-CTERM sorting domain-containing protein [Armatimonadota bacterium]